MKNFLIFITGIVVGIIGCIGYMEYKAYQESNINITVDDIVGTYSDYNSDWCWHDDPNPIGFPRGEWVIVITKISDTKFKIDGSISTTGEINNDVITIHPTKYKKGREHIDITYDLYKVRDDDVRMCDLSMRVKCIGEAIYKTSSYSRKSGLQLYDETIYLELRKVADYDYRIK